MADAILSWLMDHVMPWFVLFLLAGVVILAIGLIYVACTDSSRPTFSLKKDDWSCTQVHEYTATSMVMVGKIMVPQRRHHRDCIQWSHK